MSQRKVETFLKNLETITGFFTPSEALLARKLASLCTRGCIVAYHDAGGWWDGPTRAMREDVYGFMGKCFIARGGVDSLHYGIKWENYQTIQTCHLEYHPIEQVIIR